MDFYKSSYKKFSILGILLGFSLEVMEKVGYEVCKKPGIFQALLSLKANADVLGL